MRLFVLKVKWYFPRTLKNIFAKERGPDNLIYAVRRRPGWQVGNVLR